MHKHSDKRTEKNQGKGKISPIAKFERKVTEKIQNHTK